MIVTTYTNRHDNLRNIFIRINQTYDGALKEATDDTKRDMKENRYDTTTCAMETFEKETDNQSTFVRIINNNNGYEYQCFVIKNYPIGS